MQIFSIDGQITDSCNSCCCMDAFAKPGSTDKWVVNYAPIAIPANAVSLSSGTCFSFEKRDSCDQCAGQGIVTPEFISTDINQTYLGDLSDSVVTEEVVPLEFSAVVFEGPRHGRLTVHKNGSYEYTPHSGYTGYDSFFWKVSINGATPVVSESILGVGDVVPPSPSQLTPDLKVGFPHVDSRDFTLSFTVSASPALVIGDVYRLSVRQGIRDCDCCWNSNDCFDITIGYCK